MTKPVLASLALVLALSACGGSVGQSRLNPMNWFGSNSTESIAPPGGWQSQGDRRALVPVITEMEAIQTTGGALLRAAGVAPTQGWWDVELRPVNRGRPVDGALIYEFVMAEPRTPMPASTEQSRTVTAAVKLSHAELAGVRRIVVRGAQNARQVNR